MNNKKYTLLRKKLSIFMVLCSVFYIFGCAPKEFPRAIIPPAPKQTESAIPSIKKVETEVDNTINNNTKIGVKIEESKKTVLDQKISILEALAQAEKIKEKSLAKVAVSELEAITLIEELKKVESRNLFLEKQNEDLELLKTDQEKILDIIKETLNKTEHLIQDKEQEAYLLREQNTYLVKALVDITDESENLKKQLTKEKEISASAKVYKHWIIGLVSAFVGWLVIKNILMIYFPLTKFRI